MAVTTGDDGDNSSQSHVSALGSRPARRGEDHGDIRHHAAAIELGMIGGLAGKMHRQHASNRAGALPRGEQPDAARVERTTRRARKASIIPLGPELVLTIAVLFGQPTSR